MRYVIELVWMQLVILSRLGLHQAGAEMTGGDTTRAKADAFRRLQIETSHALRTGDYAPLEDIEHR